MTKNRLDGLGLVRTEVLTGDNRHALGDRPHTAVLPDGTTAGSVLGFDDPWLNRIEFTSKAGK